MLKVKAVVKLQIGKEIDSINKALNDGNIGKARVCARRASGLAIEFWMANHNGDYMESSAMEYLNFIKKGTGFPADVINAAERLTAKVNDPNSSAVSLNPLTDCNILVNYFMEDIL